jgi:hypothetical protein
MMEHYKNIFCTVIGTMFAVVSGWLGLNWISFHAMEIEAIALFLKFMNTLISGLAGYLGTQIGALLVRAAVYIMKIQKTKKGA